MLNRIVLMGRLTRDPELTHTQGAEPKAVVRFGLAVERNFTKPDGIRDTDFFSIEAWQHRAEFVSKHFKKGQLVCVEGCLQRDDVLDSNGNKKTYYKIVANNCYFAESNKQGRTAQYNQTGESVSDDFDPFANDGTADDLPF